MHERMCAMCWGLAAVGTDAGSIALERLGAHVVEGR